MPSVAIHPDRAEVAVYDLDRTLTDAGSWAPFLTFWLQHAAPWRLLLLPMLLPGALLYAAGLLSRGGIKAWAHRWLIGPRVPADRLAAMAEAFARRFVADHALAPARLAIAEDALAGRRVLIASASHAYYVRAIAAEFGVVDVVATEAARVGGTVLPDLAGPNCYGDAKRAALEAWLAREGLGNAIVHFTSDHHSDLPCFELALASGGRVLCANPSPALAAIAQARGWPMMAWGRIRGSWLERA